MKLREFHYLLYGWMRSRPIRNYWAIRRTLRQERYFQYMEVLGDGSKGVVVAAKVGDEEVAIKILETTKVRDGEEDIWPQLSHPNVAQFLRKIEPDRSPCKRFVFYIMMPVAPVTLNYILCDRRLRQGDGSLCVRSKWFRQLLKAISYLHEFGVCHLDIVPENILISASSDVVLADFGEARTTKKLIPTKTYFNHLKYVYRPPEIFNKTKVNGEKCDLWNFGLIVIECLTHFVVDRKAPKPPKGFPLSPCQADSLTYSSLQDYWDHQLCPFFLNILHERNFTSLVKCQCVNTRLYAFQFRQILKFLGLFMTPEPEDRVSAAVALDHPFMLSVQDISFHVGEDFIGGCTGPDGIYNNDCNMPKRRYLSRRKTLNTKEPDSVNSNSSQASGKSVINN